MCVFGESKGGENEIQRQARGSRLLIFHEREDGLRRRLRVDSTALEQERGWKQAAQVCVCVCGTRASAVQLPTAEGKGCKKGGKEQTT